MYYNTNAILEASQKKTLTQEERVRNFFLTGKHYSPEYVRLMVFDQQTPLTSVRRAITNLEHEGVLEKTTLMVIGSYGKRVHTWRLK